MLMIFVLCAFLYSDPCDEAKRDFDKEELNHPPGKFTFVPTREFDESLEWKVVQDGDNRVLARCHINSDERHVALAIVERPELLNVHLSARIKSSGGDVDKNGGLVWRYKDSKNYLLARLDVADRRIRLYRVVNGNRVKFGEESNLRLAADTWYKLRVEHRLDKVKVYLDDEALIVENDAHFQKAGFVGLYANEDAETYFDDFEVRSMGEKK